jgi:hypothetical protein
MALAEFANGTQTCVIGTTHTLSTPTAGKTYVLMLDLNALAAGDVLNVILQAKAECLHPRAGWPAGRPGVHERPHPGPDRHPVPDPPVGGHGTRGSVERRFAGLTRVLPLLPSQPPARRWRHQLVSEPVGQRGRHRHDGSVSHARPLDLRRLARHRRPEPRHGRPPGAVRLGPSDRCHGAIGTRNRTLGRRLRSRNRPGRPGRGAGPLHQRHRAGH